MFQKLIKNHFFLIEHVDGKKSIHTGFENLFYMVVSNQARFTSLNLA